MKLNMENPKDNTGVNIRKVITMISILIAFILTGTYAFLNFIVSKNTEIVQAGCFEVNYSAQEISAASIVSTTNYLEGAHTQVTLSKNANCEIYTTADIYIHTNMDSTTAPINTTQALKYKILDPSGTSLSEGYITTTIGDDLKIATVTLNTTPTAYDIYIWVDSETSEGQYNNTTYSGYIYAESSQTSTVGKQETQGTLASTYVINKYNDGSAITTVNIGGDTSKPQVHLNATQGIMLDNNGDYRYYGADPNNYVSYNDELWRIISVGNVKSSETDTVGETRVKIVKADILTDDNGLNAYSWDSSASTVNAGRGVNDWSQADLMTELNTLYLNSTSGDCYTGTNNASTACNFTNTGLSQEARNLTSDALYYLGSNSTLSGVYPNDFYTFERGTTVYSCSKDSCGGPRATTWTGRVGIIYSSDYAYATDLSVCEKAGVNYTDTNCASKDWLLFSSINQWTFTPFSSSGYFSNFIIMYGQLSYSDVTNVYAVRPVQYLRADVLITGGEGTDEKPYILGT